MKNKISIAISPPLNKKLKKMAEKEDMSLSALISHLLMNAIEDKRPAT